MSDTGSIVPVQLSGKKKAALLLAAMLLYAGFASSGFGVGVALPVKLAAMDAIPFFSLATATSTLGMMLALCLSGKLCDVFGVKALAMFGVALQFAARLISMYVASIPLFIALFVVQAVGNGFFLTTPFIIISDIAEPKDRPKFFGMLMTFMAIGSLIGPLFAGLLLELGQLTLAFLSYIPFMIVAVPIIMATYPNRKPGHTIGAKFDVLGILLLVLSIGLIVMWLNLGGTFFSWTSALGIILPLVGIIALFLLIIVERKHANPAVPVMMFAKKRFTVSFICAFLATAFSGAIASYGLLFSQQVMEVSPALSSTVTMPMTIVQMVMGIVFGRVLGKNFVKRFRPMALISLLFVLAASLVLCLLTPASSMIIIYIAAVLGGVGTVIPQSNFVPFFQTQLQPNEYHLAQGMFQFGATGGTTIYMAIGGAMLNGGATFTQVFILGAILVGVSVVVGLVGFRFTNEEKACS